MSEIKNILTDNQVPAQIDSWMVQECIDYICLELPKIDNRRSVPRLKREILEATDSTPTAEVLASIDFAITDLVESGLFKKGRGRGGTLIRVSEDNIDDPPF